jgi:hypothetical protein
VWLARGLTGSGTRAHAGAWLLLVWHVREAAWCDVLWVHPVGQTWLYFSWWLHLKYAEGSVHQLRDMLSALDVWLLTSLAVHCLCKVGGGGT